MTHDEARAWFKARLDGVADSQQGQAYELAIKALAEHNTAERMVLSRCDFKAYLGTRSTTDDGFRASEVGLPDADAR